MTTKTDHYKPEFIESFPDSMDPGVLYISIEYGTCGHLCACGCGNEVITPLGPAQWSFTYDGRNASLRPSIGNWSLPCKSHYIVDRGGIVRWARTFTDHEIARNRDRDRAVLNRGDDDRTYGDWPPARRDRIDDDAAAADAWTPTPRRSSVVDGAEHQTPQGPGGGDRPAGWLRSFLGRGGDH